MATDPVEKELRAKIKLALTDFLAIANRIEDDTVAQSYPRLAASMARVTGLWKQYSDHVNPK
jgi:hypothetical protein